MPENIADIVPEEIVVQTQPAVSKTVVGSKEFLEAFKTEIIGGQPWRTPSSLSSKLGVDSVDLVKWMDRQAGLARRAGKDDGTFYYGVVPKTEDKEPRKSPLTRPVITEEDRYAAALLHMTYDNFLGTLEKYALRIQDKSPEAFTALVQARDRMSAGIVLFHHATSVDKNKLPKM